MQQDGRTVCELRSDCTSAIRQERPDRKRRDLFMQKKVTVTIGREYGSGGREVGEKLAERLGFTFLDKNILNEISGKSGISVEELMENDEKPSSPFRESFIPYDFDADTLSERLFDMQADLILNKTREESCVVVGRCADVILAYQDNVVNVFIYADMEDKIDRIMKLYSLEDRQKAAKLIKKTEKIRRNYYQYYTDEVWGDKRNKVLMINTSAAGVDGAVDLIEAYLKMKGYVE